jgi:hypothetical protein
VLFIEETKALLFIVFQTLLHRKLQAYMQLVKKTIQTLLHLKVITQFGNLAIEWKNAACIYYQREVALQFASLV